MIDVKQRKLMFAILMLLALFAACKGESPTSPTTPPVTGTQPPSGTPPTGASVTLTVSNAAPVVNSTSTITATVTQDGQPVPNGTAVQFTTTLGVFTDVGSGGQTIIKTTTNGVATATLTAGAAGTAVVTATVNNVSRTTSIAFSATGTTPTPPSTAPTIVNITPSTGRPEGGETIQINGTNFRAPLRVIFRCDGSAATPPTPNACLGQTTKDAFVVSVTPTQITAITPAFNVTPGEAVNFTVQVITGAGTPTEQTVSAAAGFTLASPTLTPSITAVMPATGPIEGGTRVTIQGSGFQAPVQVTFGSTPVSPGGPLNLQVELQVISVNFNQIIAITPEFRLIDPTLSLNDGSMVLRVLNVNSAQDDTIAGGFRYIPRMQITAVEPQNGSALGGTQVRIDGIGFDDPVTVSVAGVAAQVIRVSGTQVIARTSALASPCSATSGSIIVTNVNTGDTAASNQSFNYIAVTPTITTVTLPAGGAIPGSSLTVTVLNPGIGPLGSANVKFDLGGLGITPTPNPITTGVGTTTFNAIVPTTGIVFPTVACTTPGGLAGNQLGTVTLPLVFTNITTACSATFSDGVLVTPTGGVGTGALAPNACTVPPTATIVSPAQTCPVANLTPAAVVAPGGATHTATITIANAVGGRTLTLGTPTLTGTNFDPATTTINPNGPTTVAGGANTSYTITVDPLAAGADSVTVTFPTNDPARPNLTVTVCGTGLP